MTDQIELMISDTPAEPPNGKYEYKEPPAIDLGKQLIAEYDNGFGASVIQSRLSYGGSEGKYEIAVTHPDTLCYASGITNDVIGYLSGEEVIVILHKIARLSRKDKCDHQARFDDDVESDDFSKNVDNPELAEFVNENGGPLGVMLKSFDRILMPNFMDKDDDLQNCSR